MLVEFSRLKLGYHHASGSMCSHSAEEVVCTADEDLVARVMQITGAPGVSSSSYAAVLRTHTRPCMQPMIVIGEMYVLGCQCTSKCSILPF